MAVKKEKVAEVAEKTESSATPRKSSKKKKTATRISRNLYEKVVGIEAMRNHEQTLKDLDQMRIDDLVRRKEFVRLGNAIANGD